MQTWCRSLHVHADFTNTWVPYRNGLTFGLLLQIHLYTLKGAVHVEAFMCTLSLLSPPITTIMLCHLDMTLIYLSVAHISVCFLCLSVCISVCLSVCLSVTTCVHTCIPLWSKCTWRTTKWGTMVTQLRWGCPSIATEVLVPVYIHVHMYVHICKHACRL